MCLHVGGIADNETEMRVNKSESLNVVVTAMDFAQSW